jgi:hypothetical protein
MESNRILGVNTAQWRQVDLQAQFQTTRLDAEAVDRCCFGIEQSIFAAPHTPRIRLLSRIPHLRRLFSHIWTHPRLQDDVLVILF